ncbi:MAG TPA: type VI secretion system contractile sheath large subunit [Polyangia bacterium]|nr:type VI secretion system contractile sheath large subunit [Polyangia bacterium]
MHKYIQDNIYKSRLTITYRTFIEGVPVAEELPLRILVLGDFSGRSDADRKARDPFAQRRIRSLKRDTQFNTLMEEMGVQIPSIPRILDPERAHPEFFPYVVLQLDGQFEGKVDEDLLKDTTALATIPGQYKNLKLTTPVQLSGPLDSEITLTAKVPLKGDDKNQPALDPSQKIKLQVSGRIHGDIPALIEQEVEIAPKDLNLDNTKHTLTFSLSAQEMLGTRVFSGIDGFAPDQLIGSHPEIYRIYLVQYLLENLQASITSSDALRSALRELLKTPATLTSLRAWCTAHYSSLVIQPVAASVVAGPPTPAPNVDDATVTKTLGMLINTVLAELPGTAAPQPSPGPGQTLQPKMLVETTTIGGQTVTGLYRFHDREADSKTGIQDTDRAAAYFAALFVNASAADLSALRLPGDVLLLISKLLDQARHAIANYLDDVYHESPQMKMLEAHWRGLYDLWSHVETDQVVIDMLDVTKDELADDFDETQADIFSGALFKKVYIDEYDRHGGKPFGALIGLYEFENNDDDLAWLRVMSKLANASHAPFITAASPRFFGVETMAEVGEIKKLETILQHPRYGAWEALRDEDGAAYIGLTLPRYMVRKPWDAEDSSRWNKVARYTERIDAPTDYLWGNSAVLFARNMVRSFENSGWCQHIRGPRGGGTISGLPIHTFERDGREEIQPPVEIAVPDYRELQFANSGFIALVHRKDTADATFFSARSIKKPKVFQSEVDTQNADLVVNLAYTLSITRIAHYVKRMMREYIGSAADGTYIEQVLDNWLKQYVTTVTNPDDLTLLYYPFKATSVQVTPKPGPLGWYKAIISVLPHVQFEGMDVELRLEAALGGGK